MKYLPVKYPVHAKVLDKHLCNRPKCAPLCSCLRRVIAVNNESLTKLADSNCGSLDFFGELVEAGFIDTFFDKERVQIDICQVRESEGTDGSSEVLDNIFG